LNLDDALKPRLVYGQSVREVLTLVQRDEVIAGLVYGTDAKAAGDTVKVIATADATSHDPIEYPAAVVTASDHTAAAKHFLEFLSGSSAHDVFARRGFSFPDSNPATTRKSP
jgi:molybdate transport system substrate-binding protein